MAQRLRAGGVNPSEEWLRSWIVGSPPSPAEDERRWPHVITIEHRLDDSMQFEPDGMLGPPKGWRHLEQITGRWIDGVRFETQDGRQLLCPPIGADGARRGPVVEVECQG
jgi:hypothetical protein